MIKWEKYFDAIYCIHFLPNKSREKFLYQELTRVGLMNCGIFSFRYSVPCIHENLIAKKALDEKWVTQSAYVNLSLCEFRLFREALSLGKRRILVIEDDIAFLTDIAEVEKIIESIPNDIGICQMDKAIGGRDVKRWEEDLREHKVNNYFVASHYNYPFATCNSYTDVGMEEALGVLEKRLCSPDRITTFTETLTAVAIKNIGIQVLFEDACNLKYGDAAQLFQRYKNIGIDLSKYSIPYGYDGKSTCGGLKDDVGCI